MFHCWLCNQHPLSGMSFQKNNKKIITAWTMYDWANSVYPLVVTTAIFPIFYESITSPRVTFLGFEFANTEIYSYIVSLSYVIVSFLSPLLSGVADYSGNKKSYMRFFCYLGAFSCMSLFFFDAEHLELSMLSVLLASIGFSGSLVFYNAYLPEIATVDRHDKVSARGFSMGYVGSSLLLISCLVLIRFFDMEPTYCFVITGVWWLGFSQITFSGLPDNVFSHQPEGNVLLTGFGELRQVWIQMSGNTSIKRFLASFFVYSMGVQTVMLMAVFFGTQEIAWSDGEMAPGLLVSILLMQFIAVAGAQLMASLSTRLGNINTLGIVVFCWALICIGAYWLVYEPLHFYIASACIGFVMGGIQSLSRSTYSKLLPDTEDHASYFSFYDVLEKVGIVFGVFGFGVINGLFSIREAILMLLVFFAVGFLLLLSIPKSTALKTKKRTPLSNTEEN